ncbi:MAG: ComEC/Rec2 family competence protein [Candidatus Omnitrophota bacterium]|nr:ComEC/Rec2 family competence protein [Candidatus Omnitrophota bacterium]
MKKNIFFILIIIFLSFFSYLDEAKDAKIHFIDVGEGDAILVETPDGKTILIDTGNLITGFRLIEYLKKHNIFHIDYLIFSHPHPDHIGGAFFVLQMLKVNKIYDNGQDLAEISKTSDLHRWYLKLVRNNNAYNVLQAGDTFLLDGISFKTLWPYRPLMFSDFNANSLVIMVEYLGFRCLLEGDLNPDAEGELLKTEGNLKVDVLKVTHHGGGNIVSDEFLKRVSPRTAIISVDKDNIKGYPSQELLQRLKNFKIIIYRTDINQDIIIKIKKTGKFIITTDK